MEVFYSMRAFNATPAGAKKAGLAPGLL